MRLVRMTAETTGKPFLTSLLCDIAAEFDAAVYVDVEYGYLGYIEFPSGKRHFFKNTAFDVNPQAASAIAKDKDYCALLLKQFGHPVPQGVLLYSPRYIEQMRLKNEAVAASLGFAERAIKFVDTHGFPAFVKPNEGSEGRGVTKVDTVEQLFGALWTLFDEDDMVLLQVALPGRDYRVVVLDGEVVSAYERVPFSVTGDGQSTIGALLSNAVAQLRAEKRGSKIRTDDSRIVAELKRQNLAMNSVVGSGNTVRLLPNANLSAGGHSVDITDRIDAFYRRVAIKVVRDLGLMLAGIDIIADDICASEGKYCILEVNSAPGLNNFAGSSKESEARPRALYRRLIKKMNET
jgi:D-alanine-D-alanine ligase-like ATP-grasp enzyme